MIQTIFKTLKIQFLQVIVKNIMETALTENLNGSRAPDDLTEWSREALESWLASRNIAAYRARQIFKWIYQRQADTFAQMTDLSQDLRRELAANFAIRRLDTVGVARSQDGSRKFLFRLADGHRIESVLIPEKGHYTLCLSCQVGCAQGCRFCLTGSGGLVRNLTRGEIIAQVRDVLVAQPGDRPLTNLVFMGMGEPLANYRNVLGAIRTLTDSEYGLRFASRRITVSTAGLVGRMAALGRDSAVNLAVSLNAGDDATRDQLMPINLRYPLAVLLEACRRYPLRPHRRITFEYILIKGLNDSLADARRLAALLRPLRCKINLIPFNAHRASAFERPAAKTVESFQQFLLQNHFTAPVRQSKGQDIGAACGQLGGTTIGTAAG
jgi:23S rRNA (adenine2503-C2)-methyltransferase